MFALEFIFLLIILIFIFIAKREKILYFFIFFLPFNTFIKDVLTLYGGGNYFSMWKELLIITFFIKSYKQIKWNQVKSLSFFLICVIIVFILTGNKSDGIPAFRDHFFSGILFMVVVSIPLSTKMIFNSIKALFYSLIIFDIIGILQMINPTIRITIDMIMDRIDTIDGFGNIIYNASSYYIMGILRMSSIMEGPNVFGVTNALALLIHAFLTTMLKPSSIYYKSIKSIIFRISFVLCLICLIWSFSRAGFVIIIGGYILLLHFQGYKLYKTIVIALITIIPIVLITIYLSEEAQTIIISTLSGKEASAADRTNNLQQGLVLNTISFWGNGLGTCKIGSKHFTESSIVNFIFELGIIPFISWLAFFLTSYLKSKKNITQNDFAILSSSIIPPSLLICLVTINCYANPFLFIWWIFMAYGMKKNNYKLNPYKPC